MNLHMTPSIKVNTLIIHSLPNILSLIRKPISFMLLISESLKQRYMFHNN